MKTVVQIAKKYRGKNYAICTISLLILSHLYHFLAFG